MIGKVLIETSGKDLNQLRGVSNSPIAAGLFRLLKAAAADGFKDI